jgi:hypothetical protein
MCRMTPNNPSLPIIWKPGAGEICIPHPQFVTDGLNELLVQCPVCNELHQMGHVHLTKATAAMVGAAFRRRWSKYTSVN